MYWLSFKNDPRTHTNQHEPEPTSQVSMKNQRSAFRIIVVGLLLVHAATIVKSVQMPVANRKALTSRRREPTVTQCWRTQNYLRRRSRGVLMFILKATQSPDVGVRATNNTNTFSGTGRKIFSAGTPPISAGAAIGPRTYCGVSTTVSWIT